MHFTHYLKAFINKILKYIGVCSYIGSNILKKKVENKKSSRVLVNFKHNIHTLKFMSLIREIFFFFK